MLPSPNGAAIAAAAAQPVVVAASLQEDGGDTLASPAGCPSYRIGRCGRIGPEVSVNPRIAGKRLQIPNIQTLHQFG
jgi:hypothetical protein